MQHGMIGHTLHERFAVQDYLGGGSMADVFRAVDLELNQSVAVKVLRPAMAQSYELVERFRREAGAMARLTHPNIVQQVASGQDGDYVYIAMRFIAGRSLADEIAGAHGPLPLDRVLAVADDVCAALSYAHVQGIVHRDIKPANILIDGTTGAAFISDFGIAKVADAVTMTQFAIGTPAYMSPEQCRGADVDARSDIYAIGCVLYEMLAGVKPFRGDASRFETGSSHAIVAEQISQLAQPIRLFNPDVKPEVERVVAKALAKAPAQRHTDAGLLARELREAATAPGWRALRIAAPPGAEVRVDGIFAGIGDITLSSIADGEHEVEATLPAHRPWSARITVPQVEVVFPGLEFDASGTAPSDLQHSVVSEAPSADAAAPDAPAAFDLAPAEPGDAFEKVLSPAPPGHPTTAEVDDPSLPSTYLDEREGATMAIPLDPPVEPGPLPPSPAPAAWQDYSDDPPPPPEYALRDWFSESTPRRPISTQHHGRRRRFTMIAVSLLLLAALGFGGGGVYLFITRDEARAGGNDATNVLADPPDASTPTAASSPTPPPSPTPTIVVPRPTPTLIPPTRALVIGSPCVYQRTEPRIAKETEVQCILPRQQVTVDASRGAQLSGGHLWWWTIAADARAGWMSNEFIVVSARNTPVNMSDDNNGAVLMVESVDLQPDHSIVVHIGFRNDTAAPLTWVEDKPGDSRIYLTDSTGRAAVTMAVGGALAAPLPGGLLPGTTQFGWHRFVLADPEYRGSLTLHYPNHNAITFVIP